MAQALTYDTIEVGMALGPVEHHLTAEYVRDYLQATGIPSGDGEGIAPGTITTVFSTALLGTRESDRQTGGIHAKQTYRYVAPLRVGSRLKTAGRVIEKYIRNGRKTVVYESLTEDERGQELVRCVVTSIIPA